MSRSTDELETRLTSMLREQAESVPVTSRTWDDAQTVPARPMPWRRPRFVAVGVSALACGVLAVLLVGSGQRGERVRTGPAASDDVPTAVTTIAPAAADAGRRFVTRQVSLTADAVTIEANGKQFNVAAPVEVRSDPGVPKEYTTLELTWREHDVEMRLNVYFKSDGREWWAEEIRTYDGRDPGEWITYTGDFFRRPLGSPFVGDLDVAAPDPALGQLHIANLALEAFLPAPECARASGPFALDPGTSPITMEGYVSGYGAGVRLLDTASCAPVPDEDRYRYEWQTRDPGVVTVHRSVVPLERRADLTPEGKGRTFVHVTARDPDTNEMVAEIDIEVVVGDIKSLPPTVIPGTPPAS